MQDAPEATLLASLGGTDVPPEYITAASSVPKQWPSESDRAEPQASDARPASPGETHQAMHGRMADLKRFTLYETRTHYYMVGHDSSQEHFQVLRIDRVPPFVSQQASRERQTGADATESVNASEPAKSATPAEAESTQASEKEHQLLMANHASRTARPAGPEHSSVSAVGTSPESSPVIARARPTHVDLPNQTQSTACSVSSSGHRYLSTEDAEIPVLRQHVDPKGTDTKDAEATASEPQVRTRPPISALETPRSNRSSYFGTTKEKDAMAASTEKPQRCAQKDEREASDAASWALTVTGDSATYTSQDIKQMLDTLREANRGTGGLKEIGRYFGLIGFVRFTAGYYMVLIERRSVVALIGGHYVYHCDQAQVLPVCHSSTLSSAPGRTKARDQLESIQLQNFRQVDLSKNFYFSYSYDITKTLQANMTGPGTPPNVQAEHAWGYNDNFMWNYHLLLPAFHDCLTLPDSGEQVTKSQARRIAKNRWTLPLVHGFVDQAKLTVLGRTIYVMLIARRSRHFAGARFHKRGVDPEGHVANEVETEQIVNEPITSPFYQPQPRSWSSGELHDEAPLAPSSRFTSYVMYRGSVPVFWTQDSTNMSPRPPIEISVVDPYFRAAALHFDGLFRSYGTPVIALDLVKSKEKVPRESKLLHAYSECIAYLNQFLRAEKDRGFDDQRIRHIAWDMSRASKSREQDVIGVLENIAESTLHATEFFHSGRPPQSFREHAHSTTGSSELAKNARQPIRMDRDSILLQHGVARLNCVDCLDRTNAAQFVLGKAALAHQLHALGLLQRPELPFDSDMVNMLTEMYHDLGDTIALQCVPPQCTVLTTDMVALRWPIPRTPTAKSITGRRILAIC